MTNDTKMHIIKKGAELIHRQGYNNTGIQEILKAAEIPKGSFYFYFKNKEDFGLQVIDYFMEYFENIVRTSLTDISIPPIKRLESLFSRFTEFFESQQCTCGCPIGNLSQEMGDLNEAFRDKLTEAMDRTADIYCNVLREAQNAKEISSSLDVTETAHFIMSSWQGALLRMKVVKNLQPLHIWQKFILQRVLAKD